MKILHTADLHLGDLTGPVKDGKNARRQDTIACMRKVVETAITEQPNVTIIAGDLFNRSRVWADTALEDVNDAINEFLRPLCRYSEQVVVLFGTENHDNPRSFEVLSQTTASESNLHIFTQPDVYTIGTSVGNLQVLALPGFDKGRLRLFCPTVDKETENRNATALINEVLIGLAEKLDRSQPSVLVAHYTVAGSEADNGSTFLAGQDTVLLPQSIDMTGVNLACLGHIHKPQRLGCNTPTFYSGSVNQLNFNDEGTKHGFYLHDIADDGSVQSAFINTPERQHLTVRLTPEDIAGFLTTGSVTMPPEAQDAIVRVRYTCPPEHDKALNKAELQKQMLAAGAFYVAEILAEDIDDGAENDDLTEHEGPAEALARYLSKLNIEEAEAERLTELALPLIKKADDGRDAGKHTGAFIPRRVEVTNYRSYTAAEFDFAPIRMAMVNGSNGVGKSSLFMDAVADCLYEQTRQEDIGGWVRDGTKSGSITFEFEMGGDTYRVVRTRTKAGRGTLAFNRINPDTGDWENVGDSTMKLTQAKIEQTLGMDCNTFCSIALIRQDAYGLFLEADSDRRMEVLSALLNLGVYPRLEELAKGEASDQRKKIASTKDRLSVLTEQIAEKDDLLRQQAELTEREQERSNTLTALDTAIEAAQREETMRQEIQRQADEKAQEAANLTAQETSKSTLLRTTIERRDDAQKLAQATPGAEKAATLVAAARGELQLLAPKEEDLRSLRQQRTAALSQIEALQAEIQRHTAEQEALTTIISRRAEITAAAEKIEALRQQRAAVDERSAKWEEATRTVNAAKEARDTFLAESRVRIGEINNRIAEATKKTGLLSDSQCPIPDKATCAFLQDAVAARDTLSDLQAKLKATKDADRTEYERLNGILTAAQAAKETLGDPTADIRAISEQERQHKPTADLAAKLEAAEATSTELTRQTTEAQAKIKELEQTLADTAIRLPDLEAAAERAEAARERIRANEATAELLTKCKAAEATANTLTEQIAHLEAEVADIGNKAAIATIAAEELKGRVPTEQTNVTALQEQRTALLRDISTAASLRGGINTKLDGIASAEAQAAEYRADITTIARTLNDYQTLAVAFGLDGIQYMIIRGIVPEIMHRANDIIASMTGGRMAVDIRTEKEQKSNQKVVNSLDVWITSITGGSRPYLSHSGGEKVKIALAVTLGLADVKARRAGVQLGMLFIDEPPFLDADGTEAYADALTSMAARNPNMRILAISHDPTMKARFQQNITVSAGEDGSTVTMD